MHSKQPKTRPPSPDEMAETQAGAKQKDRNEFARECVNSRTAVGRPLSQTMYHRGRVLLKKKL
jgi:hypothetical protein